MSSYVTLVMYHFVRDLEGSRYPAIKGLDVAEFEEQIRYIIRHYNVISMYDLVGSLDQPEKALPQRPLLLTFDDGYLDHFTYVFPILNRYGLTGAFFPPAQAIVERKLLDVNKIHFLLAAVDDVQGVVDEIRRRVRADCAQYDLGDPDERIERFYGTHRYDPPEVTFVKRALQRELPEGYRAQLTDTLFKIFVTDDEYAFANELYMTEEQLRCLVRNGMYVGNHGHTHRWLNTVDADAQREEVQRGLDFMASLGMGVDNWVMCYPYGGYDESLVRVLADSNCGLALTAEANLFDINEHDRFAVPRLDTNDLPKQGDAAPGEWTQKIG